MWRVFIFVCVSIHCAYGDCLVDQPAEVLPTLAASANVALSPVWDDCTQSVFFVDFLATGQQPSLYRYDNILNKTFSASVNSQLPPPSFIVPIKGCSMYKNQFLVGFGQMAGAVEWDGVSPVANFMGPVFAIPTNDPTITMAVGRQGESGRFYGGTFHSTFCSGPSNASFYSFTSKTNLQELFTGVQTTTGIAFNSNAKKVYHIDTCMGQITQFDGDKNGDFCKGNVLFNFKYSGQYLIGLEADADGSLYTANYYDGSIIQINPKSRDVRTVAQLPVGGVGGLTFGGSDGKTLFAVVGSNVLDLDSAQVQSTNVGPSVYKIDCVGGKGRKYARFNPTL